jgi:hypothetical protein
MTLAVDGLVNNKQTNKQTDLGLRLSVVTADPRKTSLLYQRLSVALQCFNAISLNNSGPQRPCHPTEALLSILFHLLFSKRVNSSTKVEKVIIKLVSMPSFDVDAQV